MAHPLHLQPGPGKGLFLPFVWFDQENGTPEDYPSFIDAVQAKRDMEARTGLASNLVYAPLWATMAVPLLTPDVSRILTLDDSIQGHPFFWLPRRILERATVSEIDDRTGDIIERDETSDEWVTRLLIVSMMSGWYDYRTGTWVDVVADSGVDPARVRAWLSNPEASDPDVEAILSDALPTQDDWDIELATELTPLLQTVGRSMMAKEMKARIEMHQEQYADAVANGDYKAADDARDGMVAVIRYGRLMENDGATDIVPGSYWEQVAAAVQADPGTDLSSLMKDLDAAADMMNQDPDGKSGKSVIELLGDTLFAPDGVCNVVPTYDDDDEEELPVTPAASAPSADEPAAQEPAES